jgi:hypothetical protein
MKHNSMHEWTDFVRGVAGSSAQAVMQSHLDSGCQECRDTVTLLKGITEFAAQEASYTPPASAVRLVRTHFAVHARKPALGLIESIAKLMWDSSLEPLPAGIRSLSASPRQLLYQAGDYMIDIRLQEIPGTERLWLVGQIQHSGQPSRCPAEIPMTLENERRLLAATKTNAYGEFHMEFENGPNVSLYVPLERLGIIQIPVSLGSAGSRWNQK